jgi:hypothetical protein
LYSGGNSLGDKPARVFSGLWIEELKATLSGKVFWVIWFHTYFRHILNVGSEQGCPWLSTSCPDLERHHAEKELGGISWR